MRFARLLLNPWVILASLFAGVAIGICLPGIALRFSLLGDLYLQAVQMCVLPIVVSAVFISVARLLRTQDTMRLIGRILVVYMAGLLISSVLGLAAGYVFQPGSHLNNESRQELGSLLAKAQEIQLEADMHVTPGGTITVTDDGGGGFLLRVVPTNIFSALAQGETLKILFFSLLLGVAVAMAPGKATDRFISNGEVVFKAFVQVIQWLMYLLPVGLPFLVAKQMLNLDLGILSALLLLVVAIYASCIIGIVISTFLIKRCTGDSFFGILKRCREPLLLGLGTADSFASMPSAIQTLSGYRFSHTTVDLLIPMGITMFRFGNVILFSLSTIFLMQLYGLAIGPIQAVQILLLPILAAVAAAGAPGLATMTMIILVLEPLGLPIEASLVLMLAMISIVDPILAVLTVQSNIAATAITSPREEQETQAEELVAGDPAVVPST